MTCHQNPGLGYDYENYFRKKRYYIVVCVKLCPCFLITFLSSYMLYVVYSRKYCDREKRNLEILADLHVCSPPPHYEKWFLVCRLCVYVSMYIWNCALLAHERVNGFYSYSDLKRLSILGQWRGIWTFQLKKFGPLRWAPKHEMEILSKTAPTILIVLTTGGIRCADHATPSVRKSSHYFANKRRSLGRHCSLADQSHGVFFYYTEVVMTEIKAVVPTILIEFQ
jgi:hypothetical protein